MTRHPLDLFSLLSGLLLSGIALAALFDLDADVARWAGPAVLIGVGVVVLVAVVTRATDQQAPAVDTSDHDPATLDAARAEVEEADHTTG